MPIAHNSDGSSAQYVVGRVVSKDGGGPYEMLRYTWEGKVAWTWDVKLANRFSARGVELMLTELGRPADLIALPLRENV